MISNFFSKTHRHASAMQKHVQKLVDHQRDILPPQDLAAINEALDALKKAVRDGADKATVEKKMEELAETAEKKLKPYPNASFRENVEVLLVALAVAMGIRTFFFQPFKIPTGSMQPTLFGVNSTPDYSRGGFDETNPDASAPESAKGTKMLREWLGGVSYVDIKAKADGELQNVSKPVKLLIFNIYQSLTIGGITHSIWFPPDYGGSTLEGRAGLRPGQHYNKGEQVVKLRVVNGDHLFVDRVTYNFRKPERGEIIVFETKGIPEDYRDRWRVPGDQFYIKRLVGLGGENIKIGNDRHLVINGKRLDSTTPHFEKVYGFPAGQPARESHYSGHDPGVENSMAPFFQGKPDGVNIDTNNVLVMGDNTENSLDSRYWGYFPDTAVIGRSFFVYWPLTERFGWGYNR